MASLSRLFYYPLWSNMSWSYNPEGVPSVWAPSAFARHYLRNRFLFLFLRLLRCFTSAGIAFHTQCIQVCTTRYYPSQVTPFGHPRIIACLQLPEVFRSLPRPSSPVGTKAFTVRPYLLHHIAKVFYHSYNTTKPFRDLLYCLFILVCMFLCCCSCCYSTTHLLESDCFSAIVFFATQMSIFVFLPISNFLVGLTGLEPVTPRLSSACSNQLSYRPGLGLLQLIGNR